MLIELELSNYVDTLTIRKQFNALFKDLLNDTNKHYDLHIAVRSLQSKTLAYLTQESQSFGRVSTYTPNSTESLIYISYKLYGTTGFAKEIYHNNKHIKHPMLVPAGVAIKVISHE